MSILIPTQIPILIPILIPKLLVKIFAMLLTVCLSYAKPNLTSLSHVRKSNLLLSFAYQFGNFCHFQLLPKMKEANFHSGSISHVRINFALKTNLT